MTGGRDVRYGELADRLVRGAGGDARHVRIAGAGHAAHLERPDATIAAVGTFLDQLGPATAVDRRRGRQAPTNNPNASPAP